MIRNRRYPRSAKCFGIFCSLLLLSVVIIQKVKYSIQPDNVKNSERVTAKIHIPTGYKDIIIKKSHETEIFRKYIPNKTSESKPQNKVLSFENRVSTKSNTLIKEPFHSEIETLKKPKDTKITIIKENYNVAGKKDWNDKWTRMAWKIFAYSAYWDDRAELSEGFRVTIVAAGPRRPLILQRVSCMLNYGDYNQTTDTNFQVITENHGKSTSAILFYCFPASSQNIPVSATLFLKKRKIVRAWIPVHQQRLRSDDSTNKTVVCLRPMFGNVLLTPRIAEFIAFYQIIGATHFTFYDNGITKEVHLLLKKLQEKANVSVSVHSWDLPKTLSNIWEKGQLAAIQDCIHRHMNTFEFVILVDIDEFIVPQKQHQMTVQELIHYVDKHKIEPQGFKLGSYVFRNSFFCLSFTSQNSALNSSIMEFLTQTKLLRKKKIWPPFERSKVILRPRVVKVGGIHKVIEHVVGYRFQVIPPEFGLLHHYREGNKFCQNSSVSESVMNRSTLKYQKLLATSPIVQMWKTMNKRQV